MTTHLVHGDLRRLALFASVALPVGWVLLSVPLLVDVPLSPFVLATLYLGLIVPAVVLTRRQPGASVKSLLLDAVRLPRPWWLLLPAALLIPVATAAMASILGEAVDYSASFLISLAVTNVLSSLLIVNLWEEMVWAGFVQRRAAARWGYVGGSVVTALLFTAIHLPLSLYGADGVGDVAHNVAAMVVSGIGMRLLIGAFDGWGHGSILPLGIIHATFNASSELVDADAAWIRYAVTVAIGLAVATIYTRHPQLGSGRVAADIGGHVDTPHRHRANVR
jgi:membrane protease YdiL (CAAX protease family)